MKFFALFALFSVASATTTNCVNIAATTGTLFFSTTTTTRAITFPTGTVEATCILKAKGDGAEDISSVTKVTDQTDSTALSLTNAPTTGASDIDTFTFPTSSVITVGADRSKFTEVSLDCFCNIVGASATPAAAASDCISGTSTVDVLNKGPMEVQDLEVGDQVLTTNGYESVYAFAHRDLAAKENVYSQIHFEGMTKPFEATGRHLVYTAGKANPVTVDSLTLEDSLVGSNGEALKIKKIKEVTRDGLFAPLTKSGDLLVDGIKISSYASLQAQQNEFAEFANGMTLPISQATGIHMFLAPLRMLCLSGLSTSVCDPSTYNENGMPHLVSFGINLASTADQQSLLVQVFMLAVVLAIFVPLYALESIVGASLAPAAIALGGGAFAYRNQITKVKTV